jgi:hypothetical protein
MTDKNKNTSDASGLSAAAGYRRQPTSADIPENAPKVGTKFRKHPKSQELTVSNVWQGMNDRWWVSYDAEGCHGCMHLDKFLSDTAEDSRAEGVG